MLVSVLVSHQCVSQSSVILVSVLVFRLCVSSLCKVREVTQLGQCIRSVCKLSVLVLCVGSV